MTDLQREFASEAPEMVDSPATYLCADWQEFTDTFARLAAGAPATTPTEVAIWQDWLTYAEHA